MSIETLFLAVDVVVAVCTFVSATYWMSSAVKATYAKDEGRPEEERSRLRELSENRNARAAFTASIAAYLIAIKYVIHAYSAIGVL